MLVWDVLGRQNADTALPRPQQNRTDFPDDRFGLMSLTIMGNPEVEKIPAGRSDIRYSDQCGIVLHLRRQQGDRGGIIGARIGRSDATFRSEGQIVTPEKEDCSRVLFPLPSLSVIMRASLETWSFGRRENRLHLRGRGFSRFRIRRDRIKAWGSGGH